MLFRSTLGASIVHSRLRLVTRFSSAVRDKTMERPPDLQMPRRWIGTLVRRLLAGALCIPITGFGSAPRQRDYQIGLYEPSATPTSGAGRRVWSSLIKENRVAFEAEFSLAPAP